MHTLKLIVFPSLGVALWVALTASTLLSFGDFAVATQKAKPHPVHPTRIEAPILTAAR